MIKPSTTIVSSGELLDSKSVGNPDYVLLSLQRAQIGMLIAAPESGKSHLAMSLAIEYATGRQLVGLSASQTPSKVLLISAEDSESIVRERLKDKYKSLSKKHLELARANLFHYSSKLPLVCPHEAPHKEKIEVDAFVDSMTNQIKENQISLVIIDTVSEAIGSCDEVKHDRHIKLKLQRIAAESGAALLLVHHVNKAEIRGDNQITMASAAGLTSIMRLSKLIIAIVSNKENLRVSFLKSNYLNPREKKDFEIHFDNNLLVRVENKTKRLKERSKSDVDSNPQLEPIYVEPIKQIPSNLKIRDAF